MQVQIKNRWTGAVLFECDAPDGMESGLLMRHAAERATEAGANLAGANLTDANLAGANLAGANLTDANLTDANLAGAYLTDANLTNANLAGANLAGAYLTNAYLADAYLAGANLAGANLTNANLAGANLADAKWRGLVINKCPIQIYGLHWAITILDEHMQIGCELHSLAEWSAFDDKRICSMDRSALRFWRENKDALLAMAKANGRGVAAESAVTV